MIEHKFIKKIYKTFLIKYFQICINMIEVLIQLISLKGNKELYEIGRELKDLMQKKLQSNKGI